MLYNISHVKATKNDFFLLENYNYLLKIYIFNIKCTSSNTNKKVFVQTAKVESCPSISYQLDNSLLVY